MDGVSITIKQNVIFAFADLRRARWEDYALLIDGVSNLLRRNIIGLQFVGIQIHRYGPGFSSIRQRNGRALYSRELRANKIGGKVIKLLLGECYSVYAEL